MPDSPDTPPKSTQGFRKAKVFFRQTVWLTLGVLTVVVKGRGARSEVPDGIRCYFRGFVLRCSFFVVILVLLGWRRAVLHVNFRSFRLFNFLRGYPILILFNSAKSILVSIVFQYRILLLEPLKSIKTSSKKPNKSKLKINSWNSRKIKLFFQSACL